MGLLLRVLGKVRLCKADGKRSSIHGVRRVVVDDCCGAGQAGGAVAPFRSAKQRSIDKE
ncbi:MAG: hypothetical protein Q8L45_14565 [Xanthomonadaceae bacterium]|nr:hypothetical protein [Xanthomonadaceae bacterium]MDP2186291.1 hypothetical protein [Xanthomonadales bacterium]MDZ4116061.1 hypothetical protein [Xanthomonadaceae bacterium]MDZ4378223.1 hypothetical protein [Xanthomonadaceae bacterium]